MRPVFRITTTLIVLAVALLAPAHAESNRQGATLATSAARLLETVRLWQASQNDAIPIVPHRELAIRTEELQACLLLVEERLRRQGERLKDAGPVIRERHRDLADRFAAQARRLRALLPLVLESDAAPAADVNELLSLLEQLSVRQRPPLHGLLPYRKPAHAPILPQDAPQLTPAYRVSQVVPQPADLQPSTLAPRSPAIIAQLQEIAATAGRRNWDPVDIYEWVNNNIRTEWYRGVMKGAEETLRQRAGNDADQATLLVALLRAAGYPARYLVGTVQLHPDVTALQGLAGIDDAERLGAFLTAAGIPHLAVRSASGIDNYRIEHVWVEACVPYDNYRGRMGDEQGRR